VPEYVPSDSINLFLDSAESLADRLGQRQGEQPERMAREAKQLARTFRRWITFRPTDEVRVATIQQLFELNRRAMDYLSR
jgi:hypothetical protein